MKGEARKTLLVRLLSASESGGPARESDVRAALTAAEWREYQEARKAVAPPLTAREKVALSSFRRLLRTGDSGCARARRLKAFGIDAARRDQLFRVAAGDYERALEVLAEHPRLWLLMDRPRAEWDTDSESMPRPCGSKFSQSDWCPESDARRRLQTAMLRAALAE